jgi:hypothetical protein
MGDMGGGFWASILTWAGIAVVLVVAGLVLQMRENSRS